MFTRDKRTGNIELCPWLIAQVMIGAAIGAIFARWTGLPITWTVIPIIVIVIFRRIWKEFSEWRRNRKKKRKARRAAA